MRRMSQPCPKEFRAEAVRLVLEQGLSLRDAAQRISVARGTLAGWVANAPGREGAGFAFCRGAGGRGQQSAQGAGTNQNGAGYLKKRRRTLPGNRCRVRVHEGLARPIPSAPDGSDSGGIPCRFPCLVEAPAFTTRTGGWEAESCGTGCAPKGEGDLWNQKAAERSPGRWLASWQRSTGTAQEGTGHSLPAAAALQGDHRLPARAASCFQFAGAAIHGRPAR